MKASILLINKNLQNSANNKLIDFLKKEFFKMNIDIETIVFSLPKNLTKTINFLENRQDLVFIICDEASSLNIKKDFCELFNDELIMNKFAFNFITNLFNKSGISLSKTDKNNLLLPSKARSIINRFSSRCGFIFDDQNKFKSTFVFLHQIYEEFYAIFNESIISFLESESKRKSFSENIKTFGISEDEILMLIGDTKNDDKITIKIIDEFPEANIIIRYTNQTSKIALDSFKSNLISALNEFIVTDENLTLSQLAMQILEVQKRDLSIYENFTKGNLTSVIALENSDAKNIIRHSVIELNFVSGQKITDSIYDIVLSFLEKTNTDLVLGLVQDNIDKNIFYTAVGDKKNIHIFKDVYKECSTSFNDYAIKSALFYLIKKLKFKDFN